MLPRGSPLIVATAALLLTVHACVWLGGVMSEAAIAFCAFALMIAGPIFVLAWFGSLSELEEKRRARQRQVNNQKSDALLWQRTLQELHPSAREYLHRPSGSTNDPNNSDGRFAHRAFASVASALAAWVSEGRRLTRPILALCVTVASVGPLAIGDIKYKTQAALFRSMLASRETLMLDFTHAFAKARKLICAQLANP